MRYLTMVAMLLCSTTAWAQPAFPGADQFPLQEHYLNQPDAMVGAEVAKILYQGTSLVLPHSNCSKAAPCAVTVQAVKRWTDQQGEHLALVTVAEMPDETAYHAAGALIGMVDLVWAGSGWEIKAGSPMITESGSFGKAPALALVGTGSLGVGLVLMSASEGQGSMMQRWQLYLASTQTHKFQMVLNLPMTADNSGACVKDDQACLKGNFTSHFAIFGASDGIVVEATKTDLGSAPVMHRYQCENPANIVCR